MSFSSIRMKSGGGEDGGRRGGSTGKNEKKRIYFILLTDNPAEKKVRTSVVKTKLEATTAVKGSLLYMTEREYREVESGRSRTNEVR